MARYSVPEQAHQLFQSGILENPLITPYLPVEATEAASKITIKGSNDPSLPVNWRFAESLTALKAFEATLVNVLVKRRYGIDMPKVEIDTDHAQLFIMSMLLWTIGPEDIALNASSIWGGDTADTAEFKKLFPSWDKHHSNSSLAKEAATNIYKTKDGKYFHLHGSLNPEPSLAAVGVAPDAPCADREAAWKLLEDATTKFDAEDLQRRATDDFKQAGTICYTTDEFKASEHGKANAHVGLFEIHPHTNASQPATWWAETPQSSPARPLAGLKVVDLTRIIAGPSISRGLAELGASVMRIIAPHIADMSDLHPDLNHGKWNACLDLRSEKDREQLKALVMEADVFLQGYRPGVLDKYGFSEKDVLEMCEKRERGIIYATENCYGHNGPWQYRSGWQQISDANVGVSYEYGRAMGNDEPVTPVFPNSDYCTGVVGVAGVLTAILQQAETGGSVSVKLALNYYSQWLVNSCGTYPTDVWQKLWQSHGSPVLRHYHNMAYTLGAVLPKLTTNPAIASKLLKPDNFTVYHVKNLNKDMKIVAPILRFPGGEVRPGFSVGTRTNGVDVARWPKDLSVEIVTEDN